MSASRVPSSAARRRPPHACGSRPRGNRGQTSRYRRARQPASRIQLERALPHVAGARPGAPRAAPRPRAAHRGDMERAHDGGASLRSDRRCDRALPRDCQRARLRADPNRGGSGVARRRPSAGPRAHGRAPLTRARSLRSLSARARTPPLRHARGRVSSCRFPSRRSAKSRFTPAGSCAPSPMSPASRSCRNRSRATFPQASSPFG